jgi:hypothetical protein
VKWVTLWSTTTPTDGTISQMEAAGAKAARGLSRNVEAVILALEKCGVEIIEDGVRLVKRGSVSPPRGVRAALRFPFAPQWAACARTLT